MPIAQRAHGADEREVPARSEGPWRSDRLRSTSRSATTRTSRPLSRHTSTGRRLALARWITSPDNPLAARVAINHIWLRHFGSPLVPTVFDFGMNGKPPTNQPLLDWLAIELMENGWQMKPIHKLIVTSRTYRLASHVQGSSSMFKVRRQSTLNFELGTRNSRVDPENLYYWRANARRMEAEAVRDSVLSIWPVRST